MTEPAVNKPREANNCGGQKGQDTEDVADTHYEYGQVLHAYLPELSQRRVFECKRVDIGKIVRAQDDCTTLERHLPLVIRDALILVMTVAPVQYNHTPLISISPFRFSSWTRTLTWFWSWTFLHWRPVLSKWHRLEGTPCPGPGNSPRRIRFLIALAIRKI
jgi:hypothetical protein